MYRVERYHLESLATVDPNEFGNLTLYWARMRVARYQYDLDMEHGYRIVKVVK